MKKVLITSRSFGKTSEKPIQILEEAGLDITLLGSDFSEEKFKEIIQDYDALIIGAHKFDVEDMKRCSKLKIICKHGAGLDNIYLDDAKELGIVVTNVPAMNSNAVADLAFGHILNISRGISISSEKVRNGEWKTYTGRDVYKKTLGLVGFGAIAKNVARRANGFDMKVLAYDPFLKEVPDEFKDYVTLVDFNTIVKDSDFISIHVPLTDETKDLFNKETILSMKEEAYLINTGRGGIINEMELYECMVAGHLSGAALDVVEVEPINADNPLLKLENVVITPHMGMYSLEAISAVSIVCAENVAKMLKGETPNYIV
ncbi:hydroxyacid dehydrogenase [Alkalibaculum sp. M08DMB]|uniref:Hydroxyacid dehydrogenase n=1 Tax=Alkalibaculum sporogenes TaxID=2655001 RepID=A0A6A7K7P7_9FIRM|nr:phosphoglycerate dehydrogenase [Alkalibaculum sporogenes]MPW25415.1 hydroxyacid dehydrogenase [Alkalibaculum sporogenes]